MVASSLAHSGIQGVFLPAVFLVLYRTADSKRKKKKILFKQFQRDTSHGYKPLSSAELHTSQTHGAWWCASASSEDSSNFQHCTFTFHREQKGYEALKQQLNCTGEGKE